MEFDVNLVRDRLKEYRLEEEYSQQQIADLLGIDQSQYSRIETGQGRMTLGMAARAAAVFPFILFRIFVLDVMHMRIEDCRDALL